MRGAMEISAMRSSIGPVMRNLLRKDDLSTNGEPLLSSHTLAAIAVATTAPTGQLDSKHKNEKGILALR